MHPNLVRMEAHIQNLKTEEIKEDRSVYRGLDMERELRKTEREYKKAHCLSQIILARLSELCWLQGCTYPSVQLEDSGVRRNKPE